jgi:hypothetical protein
MKILLEKNKIQSNQIEESRTTLINDEIRNINVNFCKYILTYIFIFKKF